MTFDNNGNLLPYQPNPLTIDKFELAFGFDERRKLLIDKLFDFIKELRSIIKDRILVWVDGSFVTQKVDPKDIDVVVFISFHYFKLYEAQLTVLKGKQEFVDLYYVKVFPEGHQDYHLTQFDKQDWLHFFTTDRRNQKKGFIELTF